MRGASRTLLLVIAAGCGGDAPVVESATPQAAPAAAPERREPDDPYRRLRRLMVEHQIEARGVRDAAVLRAMTRVPRHEFVETVLAENAYEDTPLPIGYGQTISQPYIVGSMTEEMRLRPGDRVLEIGTGSGYQAAVAADITPHVWTIEIVPELAASAEARFRRLGYDGIRTKQADGWHGWPEEAPFDAIVVTAAISQVPPALVRQLAPGGRMVIPVGRPYAVQSLTLVTKDAQGRVGSRDLYAVRFVPFVRARDEANDE